VVVNLVILGFGGQWADSKKPLKGSTEQPS
jgi:hypothetical protein